LRSLPTVAARAAALSAAFLLGACSLPGSGPPAATVSPSPTATNGGEGGKVAQDLTFTGKLPARWTSALVTCGSADGKGADSFSVKLTAADSLGQLDILTIVVGSGYKGAGDYSVDTTTSLATTPGNSLIAASTPQLTTTFVVNADKASGTVDSTMGHGADALDAIERVAGSWRCS
jgi:hypothetical protein